MPHGSVRTLYRYPVKSMGGETRESFLIGPNGICGDRAWAVRDEERGGFSGGKRFQGLMSCNARTLSEPTGGETPPAEITLPTGEKFQTCEKSAGQNLTEYIGSPVTLWPLLPKDILDDCERDIPLPDLTEFPSELFGSKGSFFEYFPLSLMTQQSLDTMSNFEPDQDFDVRRFRPNILLDWPGGDAFPESSWEGKRLRIGSAVLALEIISKRRVMATHGFTDLRKDPRIMRSIVKHSGGGLGIYASILEPGTVSVGDQVDFL